jgi:type VI secretion system FHA domain protein
VITLTVVAFNNTLADGTLQVHFDELGGSIGRADTNQLVLPDPERMVSRVAAQVVYRNGGFVIVDRGSNPISLNGRALASGREAPLAEGDRVHICGYELSVKLGGAGPARRATRSPSCSGRRRSTIARRAMGRPAGSVEHRGATRRERRAAASRRNPSGLGSIRDPTARRSRARRPAAARCAWARPRCRGASAIGPGLGVPSAAPSSLDQLFGLSASSGGDPLSDSALDAPMAQPNMAADADPMRSLNSAPKASAASEADRMSDLQRPFIPPTIIKPGCSQPPAAVPVSTAARPWDSPSQDEKIRADATTLPPPPPASAGATPGRPASRARPAPFRTCRRQRRAARSIRRGLNAPALEMPALTPEMMELIGQLLHEAVGGTVDLLRARATLKHEMRADVTTVVPKDNNPLKFSPNAEVRCSTCWRRRHAASPRLRPPCVPPSTTLRSHQFGLLAGMQAVLEAALQRFDPVALESKLGGRSRLTRAAAGAPQRAAVGAVQRVLREHSQGCRRRLSLRVRRRLPEGRTTSR